MAIYQSDTEWNSGKWVPGFLGEIDSGELHKICHAIDAQCGEQADNVRRSGWRLYKTGWTDGVTAADAYTQALCNYRKSGIA